MSGTITISLTDLLNAVYPQLKSQITKEPEIAEHGYRYIIWTDGTNYYAKNGTTGQIEFSGTDASTVIQEAIDAGNGLGNTIILKMREDWIINNPINLGRRHYTTIVADLGVNYISVNGKNPRLVLADGVNNAMFTTGGTTTYGLILRGLRIYGNRNKQSGGLYLVDLYNASNAIVDSCTIEESYLHGLRITSASYLIKSFIRNNNGLGVFAGSDTKIIDNEFSSNGWLLSNPASYSSIYCSGSVIIIGNNIYSNPYGSGIYVEGYYNTIVGNRISNVGYFGIFMSNAKYNIVVANNIEGASRASYNSFDGIRIQDDSRNNIIALNIIRDVYSDSDTSMVAYGIRDISTTKNNYIFSNRLIGTFNSGMIYVTNPRTVSTISVGASPFTYTNNTDAPILIIISGGNVSSISYNRGGSSTILPITSGSIWLGIGDSITVTYTSAPTMIAIPMIL
jgi:parallel beta-helix repeat protein